MPRNGSKQFLRAFIGTISIAATCVACLVTSGGRALCQTSEQTDKPNETVDHKVVKVRKVVVVKKVKVKLPDGSYEIREKREIKLVPVETEIKSTTVVREEGETRVVKAPDLKPAERKEVEPVEHREVKAPVLPSQTRTGNVKKDNPWVASPAAVHHSTTAGLQHSTHQVSTHAQTGSKTGKHTTTGSKGSTGKSVSKPNAAVAASATKH